MVGSGSGCGWGGECFVFDEAKSKKNVLGCDGIYNKKGVLVKRLEM